MANPALITDVGVATIGAGPVLTKVTAGEGSTFTVRGTTPTNKTWLVDVWQKAAHAGRTQITSPNLSPISTGIDINTPTGLADFLLSREINAGLIPQDALDVQADGTAADISLVALQSYYQDTGGGGMKLKNPGDIGGVTDYIVGWPVAAAAPATEGDQKGTVITTTIDASEANAWYALLGYQCDTTVGAVGIAGTDTSQLFAGGPGDTSGQRTRRYFMDLCLDTGLPCIPLFNAANKANTNLVVVDNAASTAVNVTMILAKLNQSYQP